MLDKKKIKEKLEAERDILIEEMKDMGKLNPETGEWEATPEETDHPEPDQNDAADRFEDFESKSSMIRSLEPRLQNILRSLDSSTALSGSPTTLKECRPFERSTSMVTIVPESRLTCAE